MYLDEEDRELDVYTGELWDLHRLSLLCLLQKRSSACDLNTLSPSLPSSPSLIFLFPPSLSLSLPPFLPPAVPLPPSPPPPTHNISLALIMNRQCQVNVDSLSDTVHKLCQPKTALLVNVHMHWTKVDVYIWTWNCGRKKRRRGESGMGVGGRHGRGRGERRRKEKGGSERHTKDCIV